MKYLKTYESKVMMDYQDKVKAANIAYESRNEVIQNIVDKMSPPYTEVYQEIQDIFIDYIDQDVELDIELCVPNPKSYGDPYTIYYPEGWGKGKHHFPMYGNIEVDNKISYLLKKHNKAYYDIKFGTDCLSRAKEIQGAKYYNEVNWDADDVKHLFSITRECAEEMMSRLKMMYNVKVIESVGYSPNRNPTKQAWEKCGPVPTEDSQISKMVWVLEISE